MRAEPAVEDGARPARTHRAAEACCRIREWLLVCVLPACAYDPTLLPMRPVELRDLPAPRTAEAGAGHVPPPLDAGGAAPPSPPMLGLDAAPAPDDDAGNPLDQGPPVVRPRERKRLTIAAGSVDQDLHDFPLWVRFEGDSDLMRARADGRSLYFTDERGEVLDVELVSRDLAAGNLSAWVRVPLLSSTADTLVYLYWDDAQDHFDPAAAAGVWRASYEAVLHLDGDAVLDSSPHAHAAEDDGTTLVAGQLGSARRFDGASHLALGQGALPASEHSTITAWIRPNVSSCTEYCAIVTNCRTSSPFEGVSLYMAGHFAAEPTGALGTWEGAADPAQSWHFSEAHVAQQDVWRFVALRVQAGATEGSAAISLDGHPFADLYRPTDGDTSGFLNAPDAFLNVGRFEGSAGFFHYYAGDIDELRIAASARSDAWIRAEHENQRADSTFVRVETER